MVRISATTVTTRIPPPIRARPRLATCSTTTVTGGSTVRLFVPPRDPNKGDEDDEAPRDRWQPLARNPARLRSLELSHRAPHRGEPPRRARRDRDARDDGARGHRRAPGDRRA